MDIDFALGRQFLDLDGRPRQLRFRCDAGDTGGDILSGTGQLLAVIADPQRPDLNDVVALSRPGVAFADIEAALDGWQQWAALGEEAVSLTEIRRRIQAAGLND
ncbi:hypothetical protein PDG61_20845 [Mycolicibacterium sp. BiH015]|uniref:hypothetical protein n=1 Tax=Mycolicibacterium sp. BiH015 TaxID=3018808 RepID=UPI0022E0B28C|nr:hypothetical protein [Mycolicibacterium sp. BiH015]MDA2893375.1 hypothetical protein [Mycolicibacterium sp. BiH015]